MNKKTQEKSKSTVEKPNSFEIISPKIESKILEKLIEEYRKDFETCEESPEKVLHSTNWIGDTFKEILEHIEEEFQQLMHIGLDKFIFLRNLLRLTSILVSGKYISLEKIKKIVTIAIDTTLKL